MKVFLDEKNPLTRGSVCGIGSFDGVHRGHQAVVARLRQIAARQQTTGIITFTPLPFFVLKGAPICCLTPPEEKNQIFSDLGVDFIYYFKFSDEFARLDPQSFVEMIEERIEPSTIVVGENFHFGNMRKGSAETLKILAQDRFRVEVMTKLADEGTISSTRIRELLLLGNIKAANRLLGREYTIASTVEKGKGRGQKIGFPTINLAAPENKLIPLDGVYEVRVDFGKQEFTGAMFCRHDLLEVHIIGFSGDIYGENVRVRFLKRIRGIEHFADDATLKKAISRDIQAICKGER